jgi:hypothetical protein
MRIPDKVLSWLLEPEDPSARYLTLSRLLGRPADDPEALEARGAIRESAPVRKLLAKMEPEGYWLERDPRTGAVLGEGVEYGHFATTHFCLSYLAQLGMDRGDERVARAAERYLGLMEPDGDWYQHLSCLYGYNIQTFLRLGYRDDARLQRSVELLRASGRADGGYLCEVHETRGKRRRPKSCIRGSLKALAAFRELGPAYWGDPACEGLAEYFLERGGIFKKSDPAEPVNRDVQIAIFPFLWSSGLVEILYLLSEMGRGSDPRLDRAWDILATKADAEGRFRLDWTPAQCPWKVGKRGEPNKWTTLYALLALKAKGRIRA